MLREIRAVGPNDVISPHPYRSRSYKVLGILSVDEVVITPIYDPRHLRRFFTISLATAQARFEQSERLLDEMYAQQQSEIRAELAVPQHLVW